MDIVFKPSRMEKYIRACAPFPPNMSVEERECAMRELILIATTLTESVDLLREYRSEIKSWLGFIK